MFVWGVSLSTPVEPLRLLLLAASPEWPSSLRECLAPLGNIAVLDCASSWDTVGHQMDLTVPGILFTTEALQPSAGQCNWPTVLLFETEPDEEPAGVSDWLLARLGSDEFALLIDTRRAPERAESIAERITEALSEPYWPRLCLSTGRILGLEALVRWRHAERGLLPPSEFVPLAEQSGLIVPLGYWVIARALRDMQALREQGVPPLHMAINLSFRQFQDNQLLATLSRLIADRGIDAQWLEFELTETAVMRRSDLVKQTMDALGRLGVRFSLDDFGTGFSSFVHLNSLPITLLKIDKSFVGEMEQREENRKLVHAMINLAHNLSLEVVAEGVETPEQLALLRSFNCDQAQGFLISHPLAMPELMQYLAMDQSRGLVVQGK
nr:diguanylate phosphodiesterase [Tanacetum cinerariifolium]